MSDQQEIPLTNDDIKRLLGKRNSHAGEIAHLTYDDLQMLARQERDANPPVRPVARKRGDHPQYVCGAWSGN